jgi:hypothetical protein
VTNANDKAPDLVDLYPSPKTVPFGTGTVEVTGLSMRKIVVLVEEYPELVPLFGDDTVPLATIFLKAPAAALAVFALVVSDENMIRTFDVLALGQQLDILAAIFDLTLVRLGWTDIDDGGFALRQKKTGVRPWCPIFPELDAEMAGWEKRPGPFLLQGNGKPFTTNQMWKAFNEAREDHPALADAVWHGLRANAVIHLRQSGYSIAQISDMIGMSPQVVERYSRHADRKAGGQAALLAIKQGQNRNRTVKR